MNKEHDFMFRTYENAEDPKKKLLTGEDCFNHVFIESFNSNSTRKLKLKLFSLQENDKEYR